MLDYSNEAPHKGELLLAASLSLRRASVLLHLGAAAIRSGGALVRMRRRQRSTVGANRDLSVGLIERTHMFGS